jgi:hypothetical protein
MFVLSNGMRFCFDKNINKNKYLHIETQVRQTRSHGLVNRKTAVGHGNTRKDTEKSDKLSAAVGHLRGDSLKTRTSLFVRVIPCVSVAELPFLGSVKFTLCNAR